MSSARKLTEIPSCMRMSSDYLWESLPEKEIDDPLSYDPPDILSDLGIIYGEGAAEWFLPPESPNYATNLSSLSSTPPCPSRNHRDPGAKKERTTTTNVRARRDPYQRRPINSSPTPASPLNRSGYSPTRASPPSSPTSSSAPSDSDDVLTPEFMRSLQLISPGTPVAGPLSLPGSYSPALSDTPPLVSRSRRGPKSAKTQTSPSRPAREVAAGGTQQPEAFADRYCRYRDCGKRFVDRRTTERHRLTHLDFGTFVCPNQACNSRLDPRRPNFATNFTLARHFRTVADDSPCAVGKGQNTSNFRQHVALAEELIQRALVPFDPATHTPF